MRPRVGSPARAHLPLRAPIPVVLSRTDLKAELERAICATYLHLGRGTCLAVKIGPISAEAEGGLSPAQLLANLVAVIPQLAVRLPLGGWGNVQALSLKTARSTSLPIWTCDLDADPDKPTSRFYVPPRTEDPPFASKSANRLSLREARADLFVPDDHPSRSTSKASVEPVVVAKKGKGKRPVGEDADEAAAETTPEKKRVKTKKAVDRVLPPTGRSAMAKKRKP